MIVDRSESHFIFVFHYDHIYRNYNYINYQGKPLTNKEYLEHWGKFGIFGAVEEHYELAKKLDPYVEKKMIPCIKFGRTPVEKLQMKECVMCVYCDDRQRDEVWEILNEHGVELRAWAYERETMEKWSPGGYLLERWIASHGFSEEEAEKVREGSRVRFQEMFKDKNAIFRGVEQ